MRASASRCNTLFPFIVSDVHHVVRFVSRLRTLPSRPRVQGEYRFRVEIWLGWVHGRRKESQDQFEVDRVFERRLPFQSGRSGGVNDKNTRGEREREGVWMRCKTKRTCFGRSLVYRELTRACRSTRRSRGVKPGYRYRRLFLCDTKDLSL